MSENTESDLMVLGVDVGGTKIAAAAYLGDGTLIKKESVKIGKLQGREVGQLISELVSRFLSDPETGKIRSVGVCVPGISRSRTGTVWAPNISGWDDYPLLKELEAVCGTLPVAIDSDRACYILGEQWLGNAQGCRDAIFLAVGTGIGAGILVDGRVLRGANDIAGAIGWMALDRPFQEKYTSCGCFEHHASGEGIAKVTRELLDEHKGYSGVLRQKPAENITAGDVFDAYESGDQLAQQVVERCIIVWGMAVANLISLFNPEKIIIGGGVFGPGRKFIADIRREAEKWAQPISSKLVKIEGSGLDGNAGVLGAGSLALSVLNRK